MLGDPKASAIVVMEHIKVYMLLFIKTRTCCTFRDVGDMALACSDLPPILGRRSS
jgi:hypothetical protein